MEQQRWTRAQRDEEKVMDYHGLVKRLDLPAGWLAPKDLEYDDIRARAISRADLDDDVQGINAGIELIRRTRGGRWPTEPVTADFNSYTPPCGSARSNSFNTGAWSPPKMTA
ncbi:MAG TPA: hypothetical protein VGH85_04645 [Mycobacteriales bacterium]